MNKIVSLDCTLRDGGYCNEWRFREKNIRSIIKGLIATKVEIVECGFLTNKIVFNKDVTKYTDLKQLDGYIPKHDIDTKFVVMMNYGEYDVEVLPNCEDTAVDGIRLAFHKSKIDEALQLSTIIAEKGYDVFLQPMVSMLYTDEEFLSLIRKANELNPFAFYIVDSFGTMREDDLLHYYELAERNLASNICLGFHSHNNLQSAFTNAKVLARQNTKRSLIIDCSISGMGRGAGNLNTELFLNELNITHDKEYDLKPILTIMDEVISTFYQENPWGYSLPNYLSAVHMTHPNYAKYYTEKSSLTLDDIDELFTMMEPEKAVEFDAKYAEQLYLQYMSSGVIRNGHLFELKEMAKGRKILLVAPGKSISERTNDIKDFIEQNHPIVISINHEENIIDTDYIFISNKRRFAQLNADVLNKTISTSNIKSLETYASVDYYKLLNEIEGVRDNAGLMAIKFAIDELNPSEIYIAGLDGYASDSHINYETEDLMVYMPDELKKKMNEGMKIMVNEYSKQCDITFITPSLVG